MSLTLQNQTQSQTRVRNSRSELVQYQYFTKILNLNLEHSNSVRLSQIHQCWWHCRIRIRVRPESDQSQTRVRPESGHLESDTLVSMTSWSLTPICQWHCVVRILYVYTILPQCRTCSKIFWHIKKKSTGASHTRMFTLFVYGSSCNSLCFGLIPSSFLFPSISCLVSRSSFGMPINRKGKQRSKNEA